MVTAARTIGELVTSTFWVAADTPIGNVMRIFEQRPADDSIAVVEGARVGLISRSRFLMQLGRRFGYSLYEHRPARLLMEEASTVDAGADPVEAIALATQREPERLYDDLLVLRGASYAGTVSMRSLLVHHKGLLLASVAEVAALGAANRRLEEETRAKAAALADLAARLWLPLHSMRGSVRLLQADPAFAARHGRTLEELLARTNELLQALGQPPV